VESAVESAVSLSSLSSAKDDVGIAKMANRNRNIYKNVFINRNISAKLRKNKCRTKETRFFFVIL
jgi:hypothetical protein